MAREWSIQVAGTRHRVVLGKGPRSSSVDGVEHSLGGFFHVGPRIAGFDLGGHEASVTLRLVAPSMGANFRRSLMKGGLRRLPGVILTFINAGAGNGGGAAAASLGESTILQWAIYELRVDGASHGSWVSTVIGDGSGSWVFVEPGGALPERDWVDWPAPRTRDT